METIKKFVKRKKGRIRFGILLYISVMIASGGILFLLAHGDWKLIWKDFKMVILTVGASLVVMLLNLLIMEWKMRLSLKGFSKEEQARIFREMEKMPQVYDFLITSDVVIAAVGVRLCVIPVRDILGMYNLINSHTHIYHFIPFHTETRDLVLLLRNGKKVHIHLYAEEKNWKAEVYYAYKIVRRKSPGVYIGNDEILINNWKNTWKELDEWVKERLVDGEELEVQYGIEHWYQEPVPDYDVSQNENVHGAIRGRIEAPVFLLVFYGLLVAGVLYYHIPESVGSSGGVFGLLESNIWHVFVPGAVMAAIPVIILLVYLITVVGNKSRRCYKSLHGVYICFFLATSLFFLGYFLLANDRYHGVDAYLDSSLYKEEKWERYEGKIELTKEPVDTNRNLKILKKDAKDVYYLQSEEGYYKLPKDLYDGREYKQSSYTIFYLPHTKLVVSILDSQGKERLKAPDEPVSKKQIETKTEWIYGDITYKKHPEIYGYRLLTKKEKRVFDFLYSGIMAVSAEKEAAEYVNEERWNDLSNGIVPFTIPVALNKESYCHVLDLYAASKAFDSYDSIRYEGTNLTEPEISKLYAGYTIHSEPKEANGFHLKYKEMVKQASEEIRKNFTTKTTDREKVEILADWILENIQPYDSVKWLDAVPSGSEEKDAKIYQKSDEARSGYGALKNREARERGYMEAFGSLAVELDIPVVGMINDDDLHYWNKVKIGENWYNLNLYQIDIEPAAKEKYHLVSDRQMEENGMGKATYGNQENIAPPPAS